MSTEVLPILEPPAPAVNGVSKMENGVTAARTSKNRFNRDVDYAAVVIGAGFGGLRILHEFRKLGLSTKIIEAGSDVGGTWYWNRYPGARTDSESWSYILNFSRELKTDWVWKERFAPQQEVLSYLNHVADRFDMRKDILFKQRVKSAHYDADLNIWDIRTADNIHYTCHFLVTAAGVLSATRAPPFSGLDSFQGKWYQTSNWPKEKIDFAGKRVAVVGTGATGVQVVPIVAHTAASVTVFQRTPNYVIPGRNHPLTEDQLKEIKTSYDAVWEQARGQVFGFAMPTIGRTIADVKDENDHQRILEAGWEAGGFRYIFETFDDLLLNEKSNEVASEFVRKKIRAIVKDEKTADLLCPDYPLLAKRPPLGHFYYEAFNRPNVKLVSVADDPIQEITPKGLRTGTAEYEFDIIIFAIGFDAVTGALTQIDIRGKDGQSLAEKWNPRLETHLGISVHGYPNMFMISGPQAPFANIPVIIDNTADFIGKAISYMDTHGYNRMEVTQEAVDGWCSHVQQTFESTLLATASQKARSWYIGANIPGKPLNVLFYFGGLVQYFAHCQKEAESEFSSYQFSK
ncbi:Phenylacetone monooxygenase [Fonsecaea pedrosoi]|nr:Phenylacetone monooxygenase [Fonsecaea pedrosoi]